MNSPAHAVALPFAGIVSGALACAVAVTAADSCAAVAAIAMATYCCAEFMRHAAYEV